MSSIFGLLRPKQSRLMGRDTKVAHHFLRLGDTYNAIRTPAAGVAPVAR